MYSKNQVSSYKKGVRVRNSYKKSAEKLLSFTPLRVVSEFSRNRGKSKLAKRLGNPKANLPHNYKISEDYLGQLIWEYQDEPDKYSDGTWHKKAFSNSINLLIELTSKYGAKFAKQVFKEYGITTKSNPGKLDPISPEVEDLSKEWHGRGNRDVTDFDEEISYEKDLVNLGELEELGIWACDDSMFTISFKKDRPILACDGEGKNLEVIGGDQKLDFRGVKGISCKGKTLIPLGHVYSIVYETDKHHLEGSNGYPESYEHYFAEEFYKEYLNPDKYKNTGDWFLELLDMDIPQRAKEEDRLPIAVYDEGNMKILIAGGNYEVTELGIKE